VSAVVEAETVDDGALGDQPEDAGARVAGLRLGRDAADLGETAAQAQERIRHPGILVEAGGDADGVWKCEAPELDGEAAVVGVPGARIKAGFEGSQRQLVRPFRLEREQHRPGEIEEGAQHLMALCTTHTVIPAEAGIQITYPPGIVEFRKNPSPR
jgi:hypothetical protein